MKARNVVLVGLGMVLVSVWGLTPGIAGGGGGMFLDVDASHPAYSSIRYLVDRGIIVPQASGEFMGGSPLLRYDAAQWLARALQYGAGSQGAVDLSPLTTRVNSLEAQVQTLGADVTRQGSELGAVKTSVSALSQEVAIVQEAGPGASAQKIQTNFVLGVTGVILGAAALTWMLLAGT